MSTAEGLELARARIPLDTSEEVLVELLEALEFIPLAITQASAFVTKRRKTVQQYLTQYQNSHATRAKLLSFEFSDHGRHGSSMESVAKTWMLSVEAIRESNLRAAGLLCQASFFQHHGIPAALLQNEEEDDFDFQEAAAVLKAFSPLMLTMPTRSSVRIASSNWRLDGGSRKSRRQNARDGHSQLSDLWLSSSRDWMCGGILHMQASHRRCPRTRISCYSTSSRLLRERLSSRE
jgi:hypothetical protein